jgi:hypothetical protein
MIVKLVFKFTFLAIVMLIMAYVLVGYLIPHMHT